MSAAIDLPKYLAYALRPKDLVLHSEYSARFGSHSELLKNWKLRLSTLEQIELEAERAVECIRAKLSYNYKELPYEKTGLSSDQAAFLAELPKLIDELISLSNDEDTLARILDSNVGRVIVNKFQVFLYFRDYLLDAGYDSKAYLSRGDIARLFRFYEKVLLCYFKGAKLPEKNVKELTKLELPTDTNELRKVVTESFEKGEQGELFLWKNSSQFQHLVFWWFEEDFDYNLINLLNKLDPELKFKPKPKQKVSPVKSPFYNPYDREPAQRLRAAPGAMPPAEELPRAPLQQEALERARRGPEGWDVPNIVIDEFEPAPEPVRRPMTTIRFGGGTTTATNATAATTTATRARTAAPMTPAEWATILNNTR